jgi:aspartate ammonia-lyase
MEQSVGLVTALAPHMGYAATAEVARESMKSGRDMREIIISRELLSKEALDRILDPLPLTKPGVPGGKNKK